ncbi:MAG: hypothetical protein XD72_1757 [Methanothrix harundinacea]|uniref:Uncharacterized protein n=1 Tax=Methanothrix harundinacea TaxID=301375 RepID=A0A101IJG1_9EURY|nr:MAG: hypothetical protein XD72_1757 [Methanothrix harundinacea]KUK95985.1 MAG: hypothetical protein XE07_1421 [Methanothrix harundinacea]
MHDCETCANETDDSWRTSGVCAYCVNGFCYCDPVVDTDEGPMNREYTRAWGWC